VCSGQIEPHVRADMVLRYTLALGVRESKVVLSLSIAVVGGEATPLCRRCVVLRHALAFGVHEPKVELGGGIALVRSAAKPVRRFGSVLRYAAAMKVHKPKDGPSSGIALVGQWTQMLQGCCVVAILIRCIRSISVLDRACEAQCLNSLSDSLLDRRTIESQRQAERQNEHGDAQCARRSAKALYLASSASSVVMRACRATSPRSPPDPNRCLPFTSWNMSDLGADLLQEAL
jgi:hypothetical protein